jgi:hypothetical protein
MRKAWLVVPTPPMMHCERTETSCVAPHASANIDSTWSKVLQAPGPPQINNDVEEGEAVPPDLLVRLDGYTCVMRPSPVDAFTLPGQD